jgi:hypothetical protein
MSSNQEKSRFGSPGPMVLGSLALTVLLTLFALWSASEQASGESTRRVVLGATKDKVTPNCGTRAGSRVCKAEGKITGYQVFQRGHTGKSFVVPYNRGKVISWSISLSNPTRRDTNKFGPAQFPYFNKLFGTPSKAGISVLRQVNKGKKGNPKYRLIRRSGIQTLNPYFGTTVRFALIQPLNVARGDVVALTIPTWAPAFWAPYACSVSGAVYEARCATAQKNNTWRGSRANEKCLIGTDDFDRPNAALRDSRPQQKVNSNRVYGCYYGASRMLYTATVVAR